MYAAYGSAVEGLARGLAVDLAPVRVNAVSPGAVRTELFAGLEEEMVERLREATLVKEVGTPEEAAEAYGYCMRCGFVTGSVVGCDGGRMIV